APSDPTTTAGGSAESDAVSARRFASPRSGYLAEAGTIRLRIDRHRSGSPCGLTRLGQTSECVCGRRHDQVAHGNVEEGARSDQVGGDRHEPRGRDVAAEHGPPGQDRESATISTTPAKCMKV